MWQPGPPPWLVAPLRQNTLVGTLFVKYASEELKKKYLPRLATTTVRLVGSDGVCAGRRRT